MGKRRKISTPSSSTISSPRMRVDVKEEPPFLESEGSTSGAAAATEGSTVATARGRLRGALREALERSDDSSASSADELLDVRPPVRKEPTAAQSAQSLRNLRQQQRRRRRRELLAESVFHHTYVMKLFDRSVDLAQFKEDTPLYPVCRAWMANQPHNTNLVPKQRTPTPEPPPEEPAPATSASSATASMSGGSTEGDDDLVRDTYRMPAPQPLPDDEVARQRLRVPSPIKRERQPLELDYDIKPPVPREQLLQEHIEHWTAVRKRWHDTTRKNSSRFEASARILKAIYRKAQKAFE